MQLPCTCNLLIKLQHSALVTLKYFYIYSVYPKKTVVLAFKICPTKSVCLACIKIHLIKIIPSTKKKLYRKAQSQSNVV